MREQLNFCHRRQMGRPWPGQRTHDVINPANEEPVGRISLGSAEDVNKAVAAAKRAFDTWSQTSIDEQSHPRQDTPFISAG